MREVVHEHCSERDVILINCPKGQLSPKAVKGGKVSNHNQLSNENLKSNHENSVHCTLYTQHNCFQLFPRGNKTIIAINHI